MNEEQSARIQEILGDELTQLLDRRTRIWRELEVSNADIYAALVNRMQSQGAVAMLRPYEAVSEVVAKHGERLELKRTKIADLRMIVEDLIARVAVLEGQADGDCLREEPHA